MEQHMIRDKYVGASGYKILPKVVLKISGNAKEFLNGLTSNEIDKPTNAFLDRMGKIIVFFHQLLKGDDVYIVIEKQFEERLRGHLRLYLKLAKKTMEKTYRLRHG